MVGQNRSLGILFCMPKLRNDPHFYFSTGTAKTKLMTLLSEGKTHKLIL